MSEEQFAPESMGQNPPRTSAKAVKPAKQDEERFLHWKTRTCLLKTFSFFLSLRMMLGCGGEKSRTRRSKSVTDVSVSLLILLCAGMRMT